MIRTTLVRPYLLAVLALPLLTSWGLSQERLGVPVLPANPPQEAPTIPAGDVPTNPMTLSEGNAGAYREANACRKNNGFLTGNQNFPNFIGFISNPLQSIDPRAVTELWPTFGSATVTGNNPVLPSGSLQVYGAGLYVALSDRLSFGLNQGGYAVAHFNNDRARLLTKLGLPVPDRDRSGLREGWLDLGGFVQYTLIADVPRQFIMTSGLRWEAPSGATQLFQGGSNPAYLAPYLTLGKEFGAYHVLATTGYEFPAGSGNGTTNTSYLNVHLDRKIGWLYPLIELNGSHRSSSVDVSIPTPRHGVIDLGTFSATTNSLTLAVGANAVLIPSKLEFGAVYLRPATTPNHFDFNGVMVKMVYRY